MGKPGPKDSRLTDSLTDVDHERERQMDKDERKTRDRQRTMDSEKANKTCGQSFRDLAQALKVTGKSSLFPDMMAVWATNAWQAHALCSSCNGVEHKKKKEQMLLDMDKWKASTIQSTLNKAEWLQNKKMIQVDKLLDYCTEKKAKAIEDIGKRFDEEHPDAVESLKLMDTTTGAEYALTKAISTYQKPLHSSTIVATTAQAPAEDEVIPDSLLVDQWSKALAKEQKDIEDGNSSMTSVDKHLLMMKIQTQLLQLAKAGYTENNGDAKEVGQIHAVVSDKAGDQDSKRNKVGHGSNQA